MNKSKLGLLALAGLIGWMIYRPPHATFAADGTDASWDAAVARSRAIGRQTVVLFTADWCPACRALHQNVLTRDDVAAELLSHYTCHKVDLTSPTPQVQAHARQCGARAIPLLIRFDADGNETDRTHYLPPDKMIAWLKAGE